MIVVVQQGREAGRQIRLARGLLTMGRAAESDWPLPEPQASRFHAELRRYGDQWLVVDLGSTNGTYVGGARLQPHVARALTPGQPVTIGDTTFVLQREAEDSLALQAALGQPLPAGPAAPPRSAGWTVATWLARLLAVAGAVLLIVGSLGEWLRVQVNLPLAGNVLDRTYAGLDDGQGWLFIGVAGLALLLALADLLSRRWGLAAGLGQALLAGVSGVSSALSFYRFYQIGTQQIWGISLLEVLEQYARNAIELSIRPGLYLVGAGLGTLLLAGLLRLLVASLEPGP
jgi:hypothetical protein